MLLQRSDTLATLTLPNDLLWQDELDWSPVAGSVSHLLTGALLVEQALRQKGRPITLQADDNAAWVRRSVAESIAAWAAVPGLVLQLTLADARVFSVAFRHHETPFESRPLFPVPGLDPDDWCHITIRLMEV